MHAGHNHSLPAADTNGKTISRLALSLGLTLVFVFGEAAAGVWANSLALLTDAAHNLTDVIALALSWYALRLTMRSANASKTFGYHRAGILTALLNSTTLVVIALGIFFEAYRRLTAPPEVQPVILIVVGAVAFIINLVTALLIKKGSEHDLNLRSAFVHLMGDVLSTVGAVIAGIVILFTGWNWLDPLVSVFIGALILWNSWGILRETVEILLEGTPRDVSMQGMVADILKVAGVRGVHDLHVWSLTQSLRAMSAHLLIGDVTLSQGAAVQAAVSEMLAHKYRIGHATLQLECTGCHPDALYCDLGGCSHDHEGETDE